MNEEPLAAAKRAVEPAPDNARAIANMGASLVALGGGTKPSSGPTRPWWRGPTPHGGLQQTPLVEFFGPNLSGDRSSAPGAGV